MKETRNQNRGLCLTILGLIVGLTMIACAPSANPPKESPSSSPKSSLVGFGE